MISEFNRASDYKAVGGFRAPPTARDPNRPEDQPFWIMVNGLWGLFLFWAMLVTSLNIWRVRYSRYGSGGLLRERLRESIQPSPFFMSVLCGKAQVTCI
jgi:hypothetical protein